MLALDALFAAATTLIFAYVGRLFQRRPASPEGVLARDGFAAWWYGLAFTTGIGALRETLVVLGVTDGGVHTSLTYLSIPPLMVALAGLTYYLIYLHTGNPRAFTPIALAYSVIFVYFVGLISWLGRQTVEVRGWSLAITYERPFEGPLLGLTLAVLLVPVLASALLYGSLLFRVRSRIVRYRVGLTAGAFVLWFGAAGAASFIPVGTAGEVLSDQPWWPLASRAISLLATFLILLAYKPPRAVRELLEKEETDDGTLGGAHAPRLRLAQRAKAN